jgi:hypothetical protein
MMHEKKRQGTKRKEKPTEQKQSKYQPGNQK